MYLTIETERLRIKPIQLEDASFIKELVNSEGWLRNIGQRNVHTINDAKAYIQKILDKPGYYYSIFEDKKMKAPIGIVTFLNRDNHDFPDIGFAMLQDYEGWGYTFEAARNYMDKIISQGTMNSIIGITVPDNVKSIRLLEKLGLRFEKKIIEEANELCIYRIDISK